MLEGDMSESASTRLDINYSLCCLHCYDQVRNYHYLGSLVLYAHMQFKSSSETSKMCN